MRSRALIALSASSLLVGCALFHPVPTTVVTPGMPNPEEALRQSMQHVDAEMAELGQLTPLRVSTSQTVVPADLQRIVSFQFTGEIDKAASVLAQSIGYTFFTTKPASAQPLPVSITLFSVPVYQVFQALGAEAGARATVQVDALHHQVEVIHHV